MSTHDFAEGAAAQVCAAFDRALADAITDAKKGGGGGRVTLHRSRGLPLGVMMEAIVCVDGTPSAIVSATVDASTFKVRVSRRAFGPPEAPVETEEERVRHINRKVAEVLGWKWWHFSPHFSPEDNGGHCAILPPGSTPVARCVDYEEAVSIGLTWRWWQGLPDYCHSALFIPDIQSECSRLGWHHGYSWDGKEYKVNILLPGGDDMFPVIRYGGTLSQALCVAFIAAREHFDKTEQG